MPVTVEVDSKLTVWLDAGKPGVHLKSAFTPGIGSAAREAAEKVSPIVHVKASTASASAQPGPRRDKTSLLQSMPEPLSWPTQALATPTGRSFLLTKLILGAKA